MIMPARNALKLYLEHGYYHIYNRGVAKNNIFLDQQDYAVFLSYLKEYLSPPATLYSADSRGRDYQRKNFYGEIELITYCLMPNHFHFLLSQLKSRSIESFARSLLGRYVTYFNKRHERIGHLFQDVYKGILIKNDEYLLWLNRYIHRNPTQILGDRIPLASYKYSSYPAFLGLESHNWLKPNIILTQIKDYQGFVEQTEKEMPISGLTLE
ncbi:MAG: hypothetical protein UW69_C0077G0018 [Microgenomates group bacterium GW2011_GWA2_44_7]|nr:MAG: hypothetical protein UW69_C0077G0018 [Microgenomates group bacterium GW2011_GWA2_44_7]